jgi:hypothetical protein
MKTVKSISDLKQIALRTGATVAMGNSRFNTAGLKTAPVPERPRERERPTAPPPAPAPVDMAPMVSAMSQAQERMGAMLAAAIASLPQPGQPVKEWIFTVERDKDGLLNRIRATAQE